jgi:hypothetical protein
MDCHEGKRFDWIERCGEFHRAFLPAKKQVPEAKV